MVTLVVASRKWLSIDHRANMHSLGRTIVCDNLITVAELKVESELEKTNELADSRDIFWQGGRGVVACTYF